MAVAQEASRHIQGGSDRKLHTQMAHSATGDARRLAFYRSGPSRHLLPPSRAQAKCDVLEIHSRKSQAATAKPGRPVAQTRVLHIESLSGWSDASRSTM